MSSRNNFPTIKPTLNLNFIKRKRLDPRITFSRTSTGTYTAANGILATAAANTPRFDYDPVTSRCKGLLVEQLFTNILLYSQVFDSTNSSSNWTNVAAPIIANSTVSPAGDLTAYALYQDTTAASQHAVYQVGSTVTASLNTAFSCFGKSVSATQATNTSIIRLIVYDNANTSNGFSASFNVANGVVITNSPGGSGTYLSSSITPAGNGWYRCYVSGNTNNAVNYQFRINLMDNTNSSTYNGDGGSAVYIWGAQAETSPAYPSGIDIPSSYIKTTSSQVSRSTDNISITGNAFNSFYNYLQGTIAICADINYLSVVANPVYFMFTGGTSTPYIWRNSGFKTNYVSGVTTSVTTGPASNNAYSYNMVYAYKANSYVISCQNSSTLYLSSTPNLYPNCTSLLFGSYAGFNAVLGGHIKTFLYYPFAASNTQLLSLSQNPSGL